MDDEQRKALWARQAERHKLDAAGDPIAKAPPYVIVPKRRNRSRAALVEAYRAGQVGSKRKKARKPWPSAEGWRKAVDAFEKAKGR